jgi:hypothetical protein
MKPCSTRNCFQEPIMNQRLSLTTRTLGAAAVALAALAGATAAQARDNVQFSVTVGTPGVYVQPAPVYTRPAPVYVQPAPVYVRPAPVYPRPVYVQPVPSPRSGAWVHERHRHGHDAWRHGRGPNGDWDRDGVPNRFDRFPGNPYYR